MLRELEPSRVTLPSLLAAAPLLFVLVAYLSMAGSGTIRRIRDPWPMSPWESAIVVDAWRVNHGQPVYADPATDHATHMYGPLATYAVAPLERIFGPDVRIPRAISLLSAIALCVAAGVLLTIPGHRLISAALIASLCFLQFFRVQHWETEGRPDAASLLFAFAALCMFYRMQRAGRTETVILHLIAGTSLMLIGFFFKQTAIAVAIVPLAVSLFRRNRLPRIQQLLSLTPLAVGFACLVALRAGFPWVYNYMITTPGSYPISGSELLAALFELIRINVLFIIAVMTWQFTRSGDIDAVDLWLLVTIVVTGLSGAAGRAKPGGYYNSYLPALLTMSMFSARVITTQLRRQPLRFAIGTAALLAVDLTALSHSLNPGRLAVQFGDSAYVEVIAAASRLPGKVVCLDDPSIPLVSKGSIGRSGECEMDANHRKMPDFALSELPDADWVIQLTTARHPTIPSDQLRVLGFRPAPDIFPYESVYSLWKRTAPGHSVRI